MLERVEVGAAAAMKRIARSISRGQRLVAARWPAVATKPRFHSCTWRRSAKPPWVKARTRFSVALRCGTPARSRRGSGMRAPAVERVVVDGVAAVGGQLDAVAGLASAAARLGELPGHPADLDDRHGCAPYVRTTAICSSVLILLRMLSAVASANVSAQSPPCRKNASPRAAAAIFVLSSSHSPANTSGG